MSCGVVGNLIVRTVRYGSLYTSTILPSCGSMFGLYGAVNRMALQVSVFGFGIRNVQSSVRT